MSALQVVQPVSLVEATRERYLNYALSVITSRALPDVRDGLKPVQRRILYTMFNEMSLHPGGRYRKCAAVVGEVMGKFHPHGDQSIYDALVRMAQDFSLRSPLVDGQGNFGSLDGDPPAAMRYTECKLRPLAEELLTEIKKRTVDFRPNYDGQRFEPIVLPAQFPQLLVNGSEGIAVGMATKIPSHNLGEVVDAAVALIDNRELTVADLMQFVLGPDFATGGRVLNDRAELISFYENGQGSFRVRSTWKIEKEGRRKLIVVDSIPYGQNKAKLLERIGEHVRNRKLPQVVDVRDESTDDVRIVLELKVGANAEAVMAWLFKNTRLQCTWSMNLTALIPGEREDVARPARLNLKQVLAYWLDFRFETVRRRFEYDLKQLLERIHILEGFALIFDALDEAIAIIRESEGKRDAAERLMDRFDLSEVQTDAILELRLYKLAKLEILLILDELEEKRAEASRIEGILASDAELWRVVRTELLEVRKLYADERRTIVGAPEKSLSFNEENFIVKEDTFVVVTRGGWIKRQSSFSDISKIRVREEDEIGWLIKCHTRSTITFFSSNGTAFVMRVDDVPATTGYGEPLQASFNFADGGKVVGVVSHDARHRIVVQETLGLPGDGPKPPYGVAFTTDGRSLRFPLSAHEEVSNKSGRRYMRVDDKNAVLAVYPVSDEVNACVATRGGRAMVFPIDEIPVRRGGKGVTGIKLRPDDVLLAVELARSSLEGPNVSTAKGRSLVVRERKFGVSRRGGKGNVVLRRGSIDIWHREPLVLTETRKKKAPAPAAPGDEAALTEDPEPSDEIELGHDGNGIGEA